MEDVLAKAKHYEATYHVIGRAHYLACNHFATLNRMFGIPVIVITAAVGTTIFGTLDQNPDPKWKIAAGLTSLVGAVLASLQTTLGFAQTAQKHKAAGESYRAIKRRFEIFTLKYSQAPSEQRNVALGELEELLSILEELPKEAPTIPDRFYDKAKSEELRAAEERSSP